MDEDLSSHEGQPATTYQPKSLSELHSDSVFGTAMFLEFFPSLFQVRQVFAREFSQDMPYKEKNVSVSPFWKLNDFPWNKQPPAPLFLVMESYA